MLRRVGEIVAAQAPLMALLALPIVVPIFMGHSSIYVWSDHAKVEHDHLVHLRDLLSARGHAASLRQLRTLLERELWAAPDARRLELRL